MSSGNPSSRLFWLAVRIFIGGVFAYAGFMKLIEPRANFEAALMNYPLIPSHLIPFTAGVIPWIEWIFGMFLIVGYLPVISTLVILVLTLGFMAAIATGPLLTGKAMESCGCFGTRGIKMDIRTEFLIDAVMLFFGTLMFFKKQFPWSVHRWLRKTLEKKK